MADDSTIPFPSPTIPAADRSEVFARYLDYYRETVLAKTAGLPASELRTSRLPSGWTPLELLKHLRFVELRWIEWGFQGRDVGEPWGDRKGGFDDDRWFVDPSESLESLTADLRAQGAHTSAAITTGNLEAIGQPGPRWAGADPASLERVLFHLLQEYARHAGHLDIIAELAGGPIGE